ncbi:MAG: S8 family serine peptidase [Rhodobacterales bacterium]|nr:S8 family serine peptidase [Rhodobacterales bacterium]MDX5501286.1 S8 family serine peptidase [Rhodobacterales bacterium]
MAQDKPADWSRRALLRRIAAAGLAGYVAPTLAGVGMARASASGGEGGGGEGGGPSRPMPGRSAPRAASAPRPAQVAEAPAELVVLLPFGMGAGALQAAGYGVLGQEDLGGGGGRLLRLALPPGRGANAALAEIATLAPGALADRNHLYAPNEMTCADGDCLAHEMIGWTGWPSAHAPRIGMIDTGINTDHEALAGQRLTVVQADLGGRAAAGRQHGTAIATLLLGRMDSRTPGLLPHAELVAIEAFHERSGRESADAFTLSRAIDLLVGAQVLAVNMSFAGPDNAVLRRLVERAAAAGIGLVAAAGNGGPGAPPAYPAAWPEVVAVTAVDATLRPYRQANRGPYVTLAAPGVRLWTAASVSGGRLRSGTSYAAPFVTAALAVERLRTPAAPAPEAVNRLIACARDLGEAGHDEVFGHGLVSAPQQCAAGETAEFLPSGE